jgi:hypothetical protein
MAKRSEKPEVAEINKALRELSHVKIASDDPLKLSEVVSRAAYLQALAAPGAGSGFAKCLQDSPASVMVLEGHKDGLYWVCSHDPQHRYKVG